MLLEEWGYQFHSISPQVSEELAAGLSPEAGVRLLAERKAAAGAELWRQNGGAENDLVIGADTMVILDGQAFS